MFCTSSGIFLKLKKSAPGKTGAGHMVSMWPCLSKWVF